MLISNIINDSFGLLSKQLRFYCWHYKRGLDQRQQQELIDILNEQYFEKLANKIKSLTASNIADCRQQIGKLLFERCLTGHRRHQLIQLIESDLLDIDVRLDNYGRTLLHRTAYNLDVELVKLLIDHKVNIKLRDYAGNTALHIAIQSYRNGALIYNSEPEVVQNLTQIIQLLLEADSYLQKQHEQDSKNKKIKLENNPRINANTTQSSGDATAPRSELSESGDEADNLTKEKHLLGTNLNTSSSKSQKQENLVANYHHGSTKNQDMTICRILGSHCMCKSNFIQQQQCRSKAAEMKLTESHQESPNKNNQSDCRASSQSTLLNDGASVPLVDTKNAFGRTALHYCVLVVGEQHLDKIVKLLLSHGADPDVVDTRLKTPLFCLIKRPGFAAVRQKCNAITHLIESGCDDLGLAIEPKSYFTETVLKNIENNISSVLQKPTDDSIEPIFTKKTFKRVPSLKHLARLKLLRVNDEKYGKVGRQMSFLLPSQVPNSLNHYINRKILDQTELF